MSSSGHTTWAGASGSRTKKDSQWVISIPLFALEGVSSAMAYTLWHRGVLIGETEFEDSEHAAQGNGRIHLAGAFCPTPYGRTLLPRLCGILTAASELKEEMARRGIDADEADGEQIEDLFETTAAGAHIVDIGRVLTEVELRYPGGTRLIVASMGFMDLAELASLSRKRDGREMSDTPLLPPGAPEFLVSVTLRGLSCAVH